LSEFGPPALPWRLEIDSVRVAIHAVLPWVSSRRYVPTAYQRGRQEIIVFGEFGW
jgi:hypothetical protein